MVGGSFGRVLRTFLFPPQSGRCVLHPTQARGSLGGPPQSFPQLPELLGCRARLLSGLQRPWDKLTPECGRTRAGQGPGIQTRVPSPGPPGPRASGRGCDTKSRVCGGPLMLRAGSRPWEALCIAGSCKGQPVGASQKEAPSTAPGQDADPAPPSPAVSLMEELGQHKPAGPREGPRRSGGR